MVTSFELQQELRNAITAALQRIGTEEKEPLDLVADELEKSVEASVKRLRNLAADALAAGVYKKMK